MGYIIFGIIIFIIIILITRIKIVPAGSGLYC